GYLGSYVDRYQCPRAAVWTHRRVDGDRDDHLERLSRNEHGRPVRPLDRYVDSYLDRLARPGGPGWSHGRLDRDGDDHLGRSRSNQRRLREYRGTLQTGERQVGRHVDGKRPNAAPVPQRRVDRLRDDRLWRRILGRHHPRVRQHGRPLRPQGQPLDSDAPLRCAPRLPFRRVDRNGYDRVGRILLLDASADGGTLQPRDERLDDHVDGRRPHGTQWAHGRVDGAGHDRLG